MACDILEQLTHVERFDMVLLFMSAKEKNGMCYSVRTTSLFCDMKGRFLRLAPRTGKVNQDKPAFGNSAWFPDLLSNNSYSLVLDHFQV